MKIVYDKETLKDYVKKAVEISPEHPVLIDEFLEKAIEIEVDALCDGVDVYIGGIMEHIEEAGIHSGDSACVLPPHSLSKDVADTITEYTVAIAKELNVIGLINIQYALVGNKVYVLEVNPRASRTVPFVSKATGVPLAKLATKVLLGKKLREFKLHKKTLGYVSIKEAVFPFVKFPDVDPLLGPEMKSTGEVMGIANSFGSAFYKSQEAAGMRMPLSGNVLISVANQDKKIIVGVAKKICKLGFNILATKGTRDFFGKKGIRSERVLKMYEGRPNIVDHIKNGRIQMVINTPLGAKSKHDDSYIRKIAIQHNIVYVTTVAAAIAVAQGLESAKTGTLDVKSIQEYHKQRR